MMEALQNSTRDMGEKSASEGPDSDGRSRLIRDDHKVTMCGFLLHLVVTGIHGLGIMLNIRQTRGSTDS